VINEASGLCVDATGWGTTNGTTVQQWACGNQQSNQEWQLQPTGSGYNAVANRNAAAQNVVWDATGGAGATADGVKIQLWAYSGGTNQQWQQVSLGNGNYEFVARNSGKCLDVPGASTANGVQLQQSTCNGNPQQAFRLAQQP
jgi:glucosylceramidase